MGRDLDCGDNALYLPSAEKRKTWRKQVTTSSHFLSNALDTSLARNAVGGNEGGFVRYVGAAGVATTTLHHSR